LAKILSIRSAETSDPLGRNEVGERQAGPRQESVGDSLKTAAAVVGKMR
jgi:hypothetical protein